MTNVKIGSPVIKGTEGSVLFLDSASAIAQDNTNLFWDDTNNRLGIRDNTPLSTLETGGSFGVKLISTTTDFTATENEVVILADATLGNLTITLPAASGVTGRIYIVKKIDTSNNSVIVDPNSTETIDDRTSFNLNKRFASVMFISNGTSWFTLSKIDGQTGETGSPMGLLLAFTHA